ncbi:MAG: hypothetical protein FJ267_05335 [Planctomycetes bacterium]|nr:hypothetical protein [Planctomycetota bacterium]
MPGSGFVWIPEDGRSQSQPALKIPMVEEWLIRNERFEVAINERTGGIQHIRFHDQRTKRLSQQLSFRFPRERTIGSGDDAYKSEYAEMRCQESEIICRGPACAEIRTKGLIADPLNGESLATFQQTVRVWRERPIVEIDIVLSNVKQPDGDPWNNYFASRFAWNDATSTVSRSLFHTAQPFGGERFETSDYIEIASETERLTIVPHGLPFHRKTGTRMVDSLLVVEGESQNRFQFTIAIDPLYPLEAAWNATTPVLVAQTTTSPASSKLSGWLFHVDSRAVQLTRLLPLLDPPAKSPDSINDEDAHGTPSGPGFAVRIIETEGRRCSTKWRLFRQPVYARKRDFLGNTIAELVLENDGVLIEMTPYEIADVEVRFG